MTVTSNLVLGLSLLTLPAATLSARPPAPPMKLEALQARATALGIRPTEIEIEGNSAEIEGLDARGRKVELLIDRRSGEVLHREYDK